MVLSNRHTAKCADLLKEVRDEVFDLNATAKSFDVHNRRIYNVTNALQWIGITKEKCKDNIKWRY